MPDNRERVLQELRNSRQPLDDDVLATRAGITPRQTVNAICRGLELEGVLRRTVGADGKIINILAVAGSSAPTSQRTPAEPDRAEVSSQPGHAPPGSSAEQRAAERIMLDLVGEHFGSTLDPARLTVPSGARVEIDGADADRTILVECWAHQGPPKAAQRHKVLTDALKLTWIGSTIYPRPRLVLCMSDPAAAAPFLPTAGGWGARALVDLGIQVVLVDLPGDIKAGIDAAQKRQYR